MSTLRRFWNHATVTESPDGYAILLDAKPMRIPGGTPLLIKQRPLADAIAAEWQAAGGQNGGQLTYDAVPLTRLAGTAQDRIAPDPAPVAQELARYAETDLLCYRAPHPQPLVDRQTRVWQPWLDWLATRHGVRLQTVAGVMFQPQEPAALAQIQHMMRAQSPATLAALGIAIPCLGSAVLGLALADGAIDPTAAHLAATLDELFEAEAWGDDLEAEHRRANAAADIALADRFIRLTNTAPA